MPLETATFINELDPANPAHSDAVNQADAHMRLIKSTVQATFPNFTAAALSATQAQLDAAATAVNTDGVTKLADAGAFFKTDTDTGIFSSADGELGVKANGTTVLLANEDAVVPQNGSRFFGPGAVPIGMPCPWFSDTLPDSSNWGTYLWLNGQSVSRTTYSELFAIYGTTFGSVDGTHFNLPNMCDNVPIGKATMGGVSDAGRINTQDTTALGNQVGEGEHSITEGEMPAHIHTFTGDAMSGHTHGIKWNSVLAPLGSGGNVTQAVGSSGGVNGNTESTSAGTPSGSISSTGGTDGMNVVQPGLVVNWICRAL